MLRVVGMPVFGAGNVELPVAFRVAPTNEYGLHCQKLVPVSPSFGMLWLEFHRNRVLADALPLRP